MKLVRMHLQNYRQYKDEVIYFPQNGTIGFIGKNGSGKSTIMDTIRFVLYGKIKNGTKAQVKNQNVDSREKFFAELDFIYQNQYIRVRRHEVSSKCFIQIDGKTKATNASEINDYIQNIIFKMDHEAFSTSYYAEQNEFDKLVTLKDSPRVELLSKLLKIDAIDKAAKRARDDKRLLELEINEAKKYIKSIDTLNQEKESLEKKIDDLNVLSKNYDVEMNHLNEQYKDLLVDKANNEKSAHIFEQFNKDIEHISSQIDLLQTRTLIPSQNKLTPLLDLKIKFEANQHIINEYDQLQIDREKLIVSYNDFQRKKSLVETMDNLKSQILSYTKQINQSQSELLSLSISDEDISSFESKIKEIQKSINTLKHQSLEIDIEIKSERKNYTEKLETANKFKSLGTDSPCPVCERPLGEHYKEKMEQLKEEAGIIIKEGKNLSSIKDKLDNQIVINETELINIEKELIKKRKELNIKNTLLERINNLEREMVSKNNQLTQLNKELEQFKDLHFEQSHYQEVLNKLKELNPIYKQLLKSEESLKEIPSLDKTIGEVSKDIDDLNFKLKDLTIQLHSLSFDKDSYRKLLDKIEHFILLIKEKEQLKASVLSDIRVFENNILNMENVIKENMERLSEIRKKEKEIALLSKLDEVLKSYKSDKMNKLSPAMSNIMSQLMDIITDGKYDQIELDDKFNIFIYRKGIKNHLDFYSGGEGKLAALCQRLAISNLLVTQTGAASFDMLALDEVFGSLDQERQDFLISTLKNLNDMFSQIIMVSHSDNVKDSFDYVLEIFIDDNDFSRTKWLDEWDIEEVKGLEKEFCAS